MAGHYGLTSAQHTLLTEINDSPLTDLQARAKRQTTLGSLYYRGLIRCNNNRNERFTISRDGKGMLLLYQHAVTIRKDASGDWSSRLPFSDKNTSKLIPPKVKAKDKKQPEAGHDVDKQAPSVLQ